MSDATARPPTTVPQAEAPALRGLLGLAITVVIIAGLYLGREVLIPIVLAVLLSFVLSPVVGQLRRFGVWRVPSVVVAMLLAVGVVLLLGGVIGTQVAQLAGDVPRYATTIQQKIGAARAVTVEKIAAITGRLIQPAPTPPSPANTQPDPSAPVPVEVHQPAPTPLELVERLLTPVLSPLATLGIVFVVALFILLQREDLRDRLIRLFGSGDLHRTTAAMDEAAARLGRYFLTQLMLNAAFGCIITAGLAVIGVPSPILWGIIAGLMRFVPYVGAIAAAALPATLAAAVDPGWSMIVATVALFLIAEPVMGQVIEPVVYGHSTGLSPISVVIAAIFWAWLWGPVGLILSMPLTLLCVVMGRHIEQLQFLDVLLGDQPALTPAESFYQRLLAGDEDEALHQAETLLKERTLVEYYDDVALKGLQLAANDQLRGVLSEKQLRHIQDVAGNITVELADHVEIDPATKKPSTAPAPEIPAEPSVLCIASRGTLDEAASAMLVQLLANQGIRARLVSADAVSRAHIAALDVTGIRMVCISYLEWGGSLSALRYLTRRIRNRARNATMLIGLWHADPAVLGDERLKSVVAADLYVTTLRECVAACLETNAAPAVPATLVA